MTRIINEFVEATLEYREDRDNQRQHTEVFGRLIYMNCDIAFIKWVMSQNKTTECLPTTMC